jgi:HPt (histidine-containing phosphotransfer) domain-containing protein
MGDISEAIDMEGVMEIVDGDQELLKECFDEFQSSIPQVLAEIQSSIEQGDASGLDESAHRLKGSLKYMAAGTAANVAYQLEAMGKEENLGSANDTFRMLCDECEKVKDFMEQYKKGSKES